VLRVRIAVLEEAGRAKVLIAANLAGMCLTQRCIAGLALTSRCLAVAEIVAGHHADLLVASDEDAGTAGIR